MTNNTDEAMSAMFSCRGGGASQHIYIHEMNITVNESGAQVVNVKLSLGQKLKALVGLGPTKKQMENIMSEMLLGKSQGEKS